MKKKNKKNKIKKCFHTMNQKLNSLLWKIKTKIKKKYLSYLNNSKLIIKVKYSKKILSKKIIKINIKFLKYKILLILQKKMKIKMKKKMKKKIKRKMKKKMKKKIKKKLIFNTL